MQISRITKEYTLCVGEFPCLSVFIGVLKFSDA